MEARSEPFRGVEIMLDFVQFTIHMIVILGPNRTLGDGRKQPQKIDMFMS